MAYHAAYEEEIIERLWAITWIGLLRYMWKVNKVDEYERANPQPASRSQG